MHTAHVPSISIGPQQLASIGDLCSLILSCCTTIHTVGDTSLSRMHCLLPYPLTLSVCPSSSWLYHHMQMAMTLCISLHLTLASLCLSHFIRYIAVRSAMLILASSVCHVLSLTSNLLYGLSRSCILDIGFVYLR